MKGSEWVASFKSKTGHSVPIDPQMLTNYINDTDRRIAELEKKIAALANAPAAITINGK